jgi:hypothetical protein
MQDNKYFNKFPIIKYNSADVIDITQRIAMLQSVSVSPYIFYPYDIEGYERADQFANRYYGDSYLSWVVYISNNILDPYREWYWQQDEMNEFITQKYGSVQRALEKTKFYRNNWQNSNNLLPNGFDALPPISQNYWEPVCTGTHIVSYQRKQIDWKLNTNRIVGYTLHDINYIEDEIVTIWFDPYHIGSGQVLCVGGDNNVVYIQHLAGYYKDITDEVFITGNSYVYGHESQTNSAFVATDDVFIPAIIVTENLRPEEEEYWLKVSYYDFENEKNEFNHTIRVLDSRYANVMVNNLTTVLTPITTGNK